MLLAPWSKNVSLSLFRTSNKTLPYVIHRHTEAGSFSKKLKIADNDNDSISVTGNKEKDSFFFLPFYENLQ